MPHPAPVLVEACVHSLDSARAATEAGAGRLELCDWLVDGGNTPPAALLAQVRTAVSIPLFVLVRPRGGDFLYDEREIGATLAGIAEARNHGADGVVIGALDREGRVDTAAMRRLIDAARPMGVTFHRAFDQARNPNEALDALMALGIERLLTSGQADTAEAGLPVLGRLVQQGADRITIMAGGSVTETNAARIVRESGVREVHLRARTETHPSRIRDVVRAVRAS